MDPYKKLRISLNPDGTLTRSTNIPNVPPTTDHSSDEPTLSKDITPLNPSHNSTYLRIFLPKSAPNDNDDDKLPLIIYFHGGGFVLYSAASSFHISCANMASQLPAIIISVEYRLAPEHRLPAAYEDAVDALLWVREQSRVPSESDPWLRSHADFSRCFLMGSSSGGNIVYHLGLRALDLDLKPLNVSGLILNQAFFGGETRTDSEMRMEKDKIVPLAVADLLWELALPVGESRDHEYCNPMTKRRARGLPRCLVRGYVGDPLVDRQREFAKMAEEEGVEVVRRLDEEGFHGIEIFDEDKAKALVEDVREFVYGCRGLSRSPDQSRL